MNHVAAPSEPRRVLRQAPLMGGTLTWLEAGRGEPLVLLHGIGSGAASWSAQLDAFSATRRVLAWDAPGYGASTALREERPLAADYVRVLAAWLDHLRIDRTDVVGHSLGAIVAAAWAANHPDRTRALVLVSPAGGYASAADDVRQAKYLERVQAVERWGPSALAAERAPALCAPQARPQAIAAVREQMQRITVRGYTQAAWMLANDDLAGHLRAGGARALRAVLCGELDRTTPPDTCERIAREAGAPFVPLAGVAHACYVEEPQAFNRALGEALESSVEHAPLAAVDASNVVNEEGVSLG